MATRPSDSDGTRPQPEQGRRRGGPPGSSAQDAVAGVSPQTPAESGTGEEIAAQIEERSRWLAAFVESSEDAILGMTLDGTITSWNPAAERIYGYAAHEIKGRPITILFPPEVVEQQMGLLERIGRGEVVQHSDMVRIKKDGTRIDVSVTTSLTKDTSGNVTGSSSISRDITERKLVETALQESEVRFRSVAQFATDAIIAGDSDGRIISWNNGARSLFGYTEQEAVGRNLTILIPERYRKAHLLALKRVRSTGEMRLVGKTMEFEGLRKDGSEFPLEISLGSWKTDRITFFSAIVRDITARQQAQDQILRLAQDLERRVHERTAELERSNEDLAQFAYVASHDLQEPLRMVASYAELLARRYQGRLDADADEFIGFMVEGAARMHELINDLLAYSRLDTRGGQLAPVDFAAALDQALLLLQEAIKESGAVVTHGPLPTLMADETRVVQLLQNLVGNAVKFRRELPPRVHVEAESRGKEWMFTVRDNGIGIDPKHAERIFVIFQRLHGRDDYPGTGIGLAICRKIVQHHGGRIWVESRPGVGSVFRFTLPAGSEVHP